MRRSVDFDRTVRRGVRGGRQTLVVHLTTPTDHGSIPVVGFVVSKAVGNAVARNLVKRRLRSLVQARLGAWDGGRCVVVRALPDAATASFERLGADLDSAYRAAAAKADR